MDRPRSHRRGRAASVLVLCALLQPQGAAAAPSPVTSAQIKEVARELVCLCGSCNRESLATCICSAFAVPEREVIGDALAAGQTPQQIVDSFVERFGPRALAAPPARGYTLLAWIGPFVGLAFGVVLVRQVLLRWRRDHASPQISIAARDDAFDADTAAAAANDNPVRQRLKRELDEFDRD